MQGFSLVSVSDQSSNEELSPPLRAIRLRRPPHVDDPERAIREKSQSGVRSVTVAMAP